MSDNAITSQDKKIKMVQNKMTFWKVIALIGLVFTILPALLLLLVFFRGGPGGVAGFTFGMQIFFVIFLSQGIMIGAIRQLQKSRDKDDDLRGIKRAYVYSKLTCPHCNRPLTENQNEFCSYCRNKIKP
jgi:hypothetical protein